MRKLINLITGIVAGTLPLIVAVILGVLIYNELQNFIGIIIAIIPGVLAIWVGIKIFNTVQRVGIVDFMAKVNATPDLDNLEPTANSKTKKRTAKELAELNHKNQHIFKGGTLKIFGDWHGIPYKHPLNILKIDYNEEKKQMEIQFSEHTKVLIDEPDHILESPTVLKILSAKKVLLEFQQKNSGSSNESIGFKSYTIEKNSVQTATNIDTLKQKMDVAIGEDALIIFN